MSETRRLESLDIFRALTVVVMTIVNDAAGMEGLPFWFGHTPSGYNGITFVDVVFPAFLFIVGAVIPFSLYPRLLGRRSDLLQIESQAASMDRWLSTALKVLLRGVSLILIGVMMVNCMNYRPESTGIPTALFVLLAYGSVVLVWNDYSLWRRRESAEKDETLRSETAMASGSAGSKSRYTLVLRICGVLILTWLAIIYRGNTSDGRIVRILPQWWGILGEIGWAYLVAAMIFLVFRRQFAAVLYALPMLLLLFIADRYGLFEKKNFLHLKQVRQILDIGGYLGTNAAIVVSGLVVGMLYFPGSPTHTQTGRRRWIVGFGFALFATAILTRPGLGMSIRANSPAWGTVSAAICCWLFVIIDIIVGKAGTRWAAPVMPIAANTLLAFMLPDVLKKAGFRSFFPASFETYPLGMIRVAIFSILVILIVSALTKLRIRLRI